MLTDIDLRPFCGTEESRYYLHEPYTLGDWTFATDGHIAVRVPKRDGFGDAGPKSTPKLFADSDFTRCTAPLPAIPIPAGPLSGECLSCSGTGRAHDCPACDCDCKSCDGTGKANALGRTSTTLNGVLVSAAYVRILQALPGIRVPPVIAQIDDYESAPLIPFVFDGGDGLLMPLRRRYDKHIEPEPQP